MNVNNKYSLTKSDVLSFANINGYNLEKRIQEEEKMLTKLYSNSGMTENDFYKGVMLHYSKEIIERLLKDFSGSLDQNTISKLEKFISTNESIVFLDKRNFPELSVDGKKPSAYAKHEEGKVFFSLYDVDLDEDKNFIRFIRKQKQLLIHEIFHIVTKNNLELQHFIVDGEIIGKYKPGALFNEALVEKSARDFATRHNFMYHPSVEYIPYVRSLEIFMNKYGILNNNQMFNIDFNDVIKIATLDEQQQYYEFEKIYNLKRYKKTFVDEIPQQIPNYKRRIRSLNSNLNSNNLGNTNIIMLLFISCISLGLLFILVYKLFPGK